MAISQTLPTRSASGAEPAIRKIGVADLWDALARGYKDFEAMPTHAVFLVIIYPVIGLFLVRATMNGNLLPLLFPLVGGFALIGPFAALGLYELSRRREQGLEVTASDAARVFKSPSIVPILELGIVLMVIFCVWLTVAQAIYDMAFGSLRPESFADLATRVFTSESGWTLIIVGNAVGCLFAVLVLAISVVSFPLLLDRNVGLATAIKTSLRAVAANPLTMAVWGFTIGAALFAGSLILFVGLIVVLPVFGHATWHLYRKLVVA
jgi:uncharacterized membrane protein